MKSTIELLYDFNPWWQVPPLTPPECALTRRIVFTALLGYLAHRQIIALSGLRRIGKTTLLKQLIGHLLAENQPGKRIAYFSFEESTGAYKRDILEDVLYSYIERVLKKKIYEINETIYIFLDEVQYIPGWQDIIKRFYDSSNHFRFIISGSSSLFIGRGSKESLAGRLFDLVVPPFSFNEFLALKGESPFPAMEIGTHPEERFEDIEEALAAASSKMEELFVEYLIKGQFPETQGLSSLLFREYLTSSIVSKVLEIDIPRLFHIRGIEEIKHLFFSACRESGHLFQASSWSQETGISLITITDYLSYLSQAYLLSQVDNYSSGLRKGARTLKKLYVSSPNFIAGLQGIEAENPLFSQVAGMLVETAVYNRLRAGGSLSFWRSREKEIDFIISRDHSILPVEVKFRKTVRPKDLSTVLAFMKHTGAAQGIIVTRSEVGIEKIEGKEIIRVPAMALL